MNAALTALNGFLLALSWHAEEGMTYTVQTSEDLISWSALPFVFTGSNSIETLSLEATQAPVFTRIRSNVNGDTNDNGLPDVWEKEKFGLIDVDPAADPDGDGFSTYVEWVNQTSPLDFYNGAEPRILLSCGSEWVVQVNELSTQSLSLLLVDQSGNPIADAPVNLRLQSGGNGLLQYGDPTSSAVPEMLAYTDDLGRIHPELHAIHYAANTSLPNEDKLIIEAGEASVEIRIHVIPGEGNGPPREIQRSVISDQITTYTWKGDPDGARSFRIEELTSIGEWESVLELPAREIPDSDPETERYACTRTVPLSLPGKGSFQPDIGRE